MAPRPGAAAAAVAALTLAGGGDAAGVGWPRCQETGKVLRHNGFHALFTDLAKAIGAKEGCFEGDCTRTDKFVCPSPSQCATACTQVSGCKFWTYEHAITKCFLRKSDVGREAHPDFVSGDRDCYPDAPPVSGGPAGRVAVPFAQAAHWAASLPALRACDSGVGSPGCDNPYAAMAVWRYALNNLRLAVSRLSEAERVQHQSTVQYVQQIGSDIATFYAQPSGESFQVAVSNSRAVFDALDGWLRSARPSQIEAGGQHSGAPHLPSGHSLKLPQAAAGMSAASVKLADGRSMPLIGFGTWNLAGQEAYDATLAALQAGYRHIDTAQAYQNEREVGLAIRDSGVPRSELFIVTKISDPSEYAALEKRLESQLKTLGLEYLDLYMLHSPADRGAQEAAWRSMEAAQAKGLVRSLGVSNFGPEELEELLAFAKSKPVYVQNKFSVYSPGEQHPGSRSILALAREQGIQVMGYSVINPWPLLLPPLQDPHVLSMAERHGRTASQVLHRWALQLGVAVIPKSATTSRIQENAKVLDFELSELDMRMLSGLVVLSESTAGGGPSPSWADDVYGLGAAVV